MILNNKDYAQFHKEHVSYYVFNNPVPDNALSLFFENMYFFICVPNTIWKELYSYDSDEFDF